MVTSSHQRVGEYSLTPQQRSSSQAAVAPAKTSPTTVSARIALAIGTVSFSALLLELSLTRLFSVVLFYHLAFLAVSLALLGLGAGGVFAYVRGEQLHRIPLGRLCSALAVGDAAAILIALTLVLRLPVSLLLSKGNMARLTAIYFLCAIPFFLTGLILSSCFARKTEQIGKLYAADLIGGATACLLLVPLLNFVGAPNAIIVAALIMLVSALLWSPDQRWIAIAGLGVALLMVVNLRTRWIDVVYAKGMRVSKPEFARWNAISRIQVDTTSAPWAAEQVDNAGPVKSIAIDADANTFVMAADPHAWSPGYQSALMSKAPSVVNILRPHGTFAIIGPGGGVDVVRAVANGSPSVTGIEINPIIATDLMRSKYADYSHHLYSIPEVHIEVRDGRSFIRSSGDKFDVIEMTLVDTWASTAAGAFALSENNLYTTQAFHEYFQHLQPDGMLAITRWEFRQPREALRVVSQAIAALRQEGVTDFTRHIIVISDGELDHDGRPVAVLAKRSEFTPAEEDQVRAHLRQHPNLVAVYLPGEDEVAQGRFAATEFRDLIASGDPDRFARGYTFDVSTASDNQPFFFFTLRLSKALQLATGKSGLDWKMNLGVLVLFALLAISAFAVAAFLVIPLLMSGSARHLEKLPLLYFIALGLGYILIEMVFIQRFVLFLGHPTYAITVVVFLMLLASGLGSLNSSRWIKTERSLRPLIAAIALIAACYCLMLPMVLTPLVGLPLPAKLIITALLIAPLAFLMGMPFPTGLRALSLKATGTVEWAWALNAGASVLGSAFAIVIALEFGLTVVLLTAAIIYALAGALSVSLRSADS